MITKMMVVLAISKKPGGRCLAGKEVFWRGAAWEIGPWIRPVTTESSGAVPESQMAFAMGRLPRLLEIIEIPLEKPVPMRDQPENWLITMPMQAISWKSRGFFAWHEVQRLLDKPDGLWNDHSDARRVKSGYIPKMRQPASLYLIKPERIQSIKIWAAPSQFEPTGVRRRRRAVLVYAGVTHELAIDDTDFENKYYPIFPELNAPPFCPKLRNPQETLICVSLALEHLDHFHYKIAAAFLEPPQ
jgi:hypothetical protein